jgi:Cu/Ag efflux pump CusA
MAVPGVANVAIWGQRDKQYQVLVDPERLRAAGVTLEAVMRAAGDASLLGAGGFIDTPNQRMAARQLVSIACAEDLARAVVAFRNGAPIRLGDVARVVIGHPAPIGDAVINDGPGLLLIVEKQPWGNTIEVTREVERALADLKPGLAGVELDSTIFRPATFIEMSLDNLSQAMWLGCALVAAILIFLLFDWRAAFISLTAIPLSLLVAMLASLLVALTVTPALSLMLLHGKPERKHDAPPVAWLKRRYGAVLPWFVERPKLAAVVLVAAFGATATFSCIGSRSLAPPSRQ